MSFNSDGVRQGNQPPALDPHLVGLVVIDPIGYVLDALCGQNVGGVEGFSEAGPHPAAGRAAAELADHVDGLADGGALVRFPVQNLLDVAVAEQLPLAIQTGLDQLWVMLADGGVQADGAGQAEVAQRSLQPPEAYPHSVVEPRVVGNVRRHRGALGGG